MWPRSGHRLPGPGRVRARRAPPALTGRGAAFGRRLRPSSRSSLRLDTDCKAAVLLPAFRATRQPAHGAQVPAQVVRQPAEEPEPARRRCVRSFQTVGSSANVRPSRHALKQSSSATSKPPWLSIVRAREPRAVVELEVAGRVRDRESEQRERAARPSARGRALEPAAAFLAAARRRSGTRRRRRRRRSTPSIISGRCRARRSRSPIMTTTGPGSHAREGVAERVDDAAARRVLARRGRAGPRARARG